MDNKRPKKKHRRQIIVDRTFQAGYAIKLFMSIAFVSVVALALLYWWHISYLKQLLTSLNIYDGEIKIMLFKETALSFLPVFVLVLILSFLLFIYALFVFHRIAGPVFRLRKFMNIVKDGSYNIKLFFRPKDELKGIADDFNSMLSCILNKEKEEVKAIEDFEARLDLLIGEAKEGLALEKYKTLKADIQKFRERKETYLEEKQL